MLRLVLSRDFEHLRWMITPAAFFFRRFVWVWLLAGWAIVAPISSQADIIWSDLGTTVARETGPGNDILGGAVKRDAASADALYFKFHVNPISDAGTEPVLRRVRAL